MFCNIKEAHLIDESGYRGTFGVFLGLLKNLFNLEVLYVDSQDRNLNVLFEEFLQRMSKLKAIYLSITSTRVVEILNTIKNLVPSLERLTIGCQYVEEARNIFQSNFVEICAI